MISTDIILIGAGPIGLELAVALKSVGASYIHLEAGQIAQTVSWYPAQTRFFSSPERIAIANVPLHTIDQSKATREEYLAYLRGIVQQFDLDIHTFERVETVQREPDGFVIRTRRSDAQQIYAARRIVLAVGDMAKPRLLHVPGEDLPHVSHYFTDPHQYFRQKLLVVGGGNSAVEAALRCFRVGAQVSLSYRRDHFDESAIKYWLLPELQALIKHDKVAFHPQTVVRSIAPGKVTLVPVGPSTNGADENAGSTLDADFVLLLTGYVADSTLLDMLGVRLEGENRSPVIDPQTMQTNVPGVYVVGTAVAGTQTHFRLFIENCHIHVSRVVKALTGKQVLAATPKDFGLPEN
ncbi:MAG: NAD(P)-binding domain-containing protein [Phycisphaeraceae bacterium]